MAVASSDFLLIPLPHNRNFKGRWQRPTLAMVPTARGGNTGILHKGRGQHQILISSLHVYPEAISRLQAFHVAGPDGRANWFSDRRIVTDVRNEQYSSH